MYIAMLTLEVAPYNFEKHVSLFSVDWSSTLAISIIVFAV